MKLIVAGGAAVLLLVVGPAHAQDGDGTSVSAVAPAANPAPLTPAVAPGGATKKLLKRLTGSWTYKAENAQLAAAITASSDLTYQINALTSSGKLTYMEVSGGTPGQLGGSIPGNGFAFTSGFLADLRSDHPHANIVSNDGPNLLADNTVFVLGQMAYHMANDAGADTNAQADMQSAIDKAYADAKPGEAPDMTAILNQFSDSKMRVEAAAFIQGWNDTVDAAARAKGTPLTPQEAASLLMNLRYRSYFLAAMPKTGETLRFSDDGRIPPDDENLKIMGEALGKSAVADFQ